MHTNLIPASAKEYIIEHKDTPIRQIVKLVQKDLDIVLTFHNVRDIINALKNKTVDVQSNLHALNEDIEEDCHYELTEDYYIFYVKKTNLAWVVEKIKYPIEIKTVDSIFKDYSKHWNNLTWDEILQKYEIKPELFNILKSRLRLYKTSHVISPATLDRCSDEELQTIIDWAVTEHIKDRYKSKFTKTFEKMKQEDYIRKSKILSSHEYFLESLQDYLKTYIPRELNIVQDIINNNDEISVLFSDLHLWKMNTENVLNRINRMTIDLINRPEKNINMICIWDLFETLTKWWMHKWQVESMEWPFWFDLLLKVVNVFETMLASLYKSWKKIKFFWLGGNHDRFTEKSDDSFAWIAAMAAYEMISRWLQNLDMEINLLREEWNVVDLQWFRYILHHGNNGATKKKPSQVLWEKGKQWVPNIIAMWDKHHKEEIDPNSDATFLIVPWMAWPNEYDKKLLLSSYPWYVIVAKDYFDNTPATTTRRFKNN